MSRAIKSAVIRADGSKVIGMGHLSRASLIAGAFEEQGIRASIALRDDDDAARFLSGRPGSVQRIARDLSFKDELETVRKMVSSPGSAFVLDKLNRDEYAGFVSSLKAADCLTVMISDEVEKQRFDTDIVLNGNPCQLNHDYSGTPGRYLTGPRYFIMDRRYAGASVKEPRGSVRNVLVTVGGADHNDLLFKIIGAFESFGGKYHLKIFSTSSTGYADRLKARLAGSALSHELYLDEKSLVPHWPGCDVAITAGGNTLFERIATRLPGATLCQIPLQMKIAEAFEAMGVNVNLGSGADIEQKALIEKLKRFLNDFDEHRSQYRKSAGVVDGRGLDHLMEAIKNS